jgi:hypothetical protein
MKPRTIAATLLMTAALSGLPPARLAAHTQATAAGGTTAERESAADRDNAQVTRQQVRELLNEYPPSLAQVLRLDPSLMTNPAYLAPYPRLATYIGQHPEVMRNPSFFLGDPRFGIENGRRDTIRAVEDAMTGLAFFVFFMTALAMLTHVGRSILEHRRWLLATKIQTDAHTKLVDRLTSNEDLLAYVQSPTGQRFFNATPIAIDPEPRFANIGAPVGRILASVQIGIVAAFAGAGLWIAKNRVIEEVAQPLHVIAILAIALGIGFVFAALVSYGLSKQMGLLKPSTHA